MYIYIYVYIVSILYVHSCEFFTVSVNHQVFGYFLQVFPRLTFFVMKFRMVYY